ncbi:MAG: O-antigen ligase family protein [Xanthomonadales bacterium]|nr:O-antigen ligase family protein [Xanthomonadales bacterium]
MSGLARTRVLRPVGPLTALLPPAALGLFLFLTSSWDLIASLGAFNTKRALQPLVLALSISVLFHRPIRVAFQAQLSRMPHWLRIVVVAFFTLGLISALRHASYFYGLADIAMLFLIALLVPLLAACRTVAGGSFDRLAIILVVATGLSVALQELLALLVFWQSGNVYSFEHMLVRFAHPRFYNHLQSWTLPLLAAIPFVLTGLRGARWIAIGLLGLQWCLLVISGGRGSTLALLVGLIAVSLLWRGPKKDWILTHVLGLVAGITLYMLIAWVQAGTGSDSGAFTEHSVGRSLSHSTGRTHMWQLAIEEARRDPWLGAGAMRYDCDSRGQRPAHPHSFPMRILSEWGVPALLFAIVATAWLFIQLLRSLALPKSGPSGASPLLAGVAAGLIAAAVHACLSGVLTMPASQIAGILMCGWALGLTQRDESNSGDQTGSGTGITVTAIAGLAICTALAIFNMKELNEYGHRTAYLVSQGPPQPRYWQHGHACSYVGR